MSEKTMSVLLIVVLLLLVLIPFLLTTNLTVLLLLFLLIYLIFVRHIYMCMIAHKPDRLRRRSSAACAHNFDYTFQRSNPSNSNNNCNHSNNEISMISSDTTTTTTATNAVHTHSHFNTESSVMTAHVPRDNNLLTIETLYVALQETDGQRSPGPPSYEEAIRNKQRLAFDEQPPNYLEAVRNIDVEKC